MSRGYRINRGICEPAGGRYAGTRRARHLQRFGNEKIMSLAVPTWFAACLLFANGAGTVVVTIATRRASQLLRDTQFHPSELLAVLPLLLCALVPFLYCGLFGNFNALGLPIRIVTTVCFWGSPVFLAYAVALLVHFYRRLLKRQTRVFLIAFVAVTLVPIVLAVVWAVGMAIYGFQIQT